MRVTHVCFVGTRTEYVDQTVRLFRDVLGMTMGFEHPGWSGFKLSTGERDFVEVFNTADRDERLFPHEAGSGPLVAFAVDDLATARNELIAAGVELIGDLVWADVLFDDPASAGFGWCLFGGLMATSTCSSGMLRMFPRSRLPDEDPSVPCSRWAGRRCP